MTQTISDRVSLKPEICIDQARENSFYFHQNRVRLMDLVISQTA